MKKERININGDYLLIAPKKDIGNYQALVERDFLADNIIAFLKNHPDIHVHQITIYELREVNEGSNCKNCSA